MPDKIEEELKDRADNFDEYLEELLAGLDIHPGLEDPVSYTLLASGKRIRPILTTAVCRMLEGELRAARDFGAALEFIHTYSLIHDDLPCMDDDELRRGKKASHIVFGEARAVLAGDALQSLAFEILAGIEEIDYRSRCRLVELLASAAGPAGMVAGQALDLKAEDQDISLEELKEIHRAKTGALFRAAILGGAHCADSTEKQRLSLEEYAQKLGLTFQIVDDILDVTGSEEKLGKKVGGDEAGQKTTYITLLGLEAAREEARAAARSARKALSPFGERAEFLSELVNFVLERQY